jgi:hypothetical protein
MAKVKIEVYEGGVPSATISIPLWVMTSASELIPKLTGKKLQERIDLEEIIALIKDPQAAGSILEIEDHQAKDRLVISIVGNDAPPERM